MDGATIAQLAATAVALALGGLAYLRNRRTDDRKANNDDFKTVTAGLQTLVGELRSEVGRLRAEVHDCEMDKAQMRGRFEAQIEGLQGQVNELRGLTGA